MNDEINKYIEDLLGVACCPEHDYSCRQVYEYVKQLQSNWNSLREWLEEQHQFIIEIPAYTKEISIEHKTMEICYEDVLDKMNELEGKDKE